MSTEKEIHTLSQTPPFRLTEVEGVHRVEFVAGPRACYFCGEGERNYLALPELFEYLAGLGIKKVRIFIRHSCLTTYRIDEVARIAAQNDIEPSIGYPAGTGLPHGLNPRKWVELIPENDI